MEKRNISVCFSSELFHKYEEKDSIIVIVDVLRATSVINTAFHFGIKEIIPVLTLEEALQYKGRKGYIIAGERNAKPIKEFDYGNSPFQYMDEKIKDKTLVLTTTNGTRAIHLASGYNVIIASFINIDIVKNYLENTNKDVVIFCAGWKGYFNLEDSIYAGRLAERLLKSNQFSSICDSLLASISLSDSAGNDLFSFLNNSSHRNRLKHLNMEQDTRFCLNPTFKSDVIPIFSNNKLIRLDI